MTVDWSEWYRTTYGDLVRFLYRKVWDADRAHDLAQETFMRALDQQPEHPRAWLFTVAVNLARDEARTVLRRKRHLALIKSEAERSGAGDRDPGVELEQKEAAAAVRRTLEKLSEQDREVLLLWDAGLSYQEISAQTGLAVGAIGTTLARARRRLVEAFAKEEGGHVASG